MEISHSEIIRDLYPSAWDLYDSLTGIDGVYVSSIVYPVGVVFYVTSLKDTGSSARTRLTVAPTSRFVEKRCRAPVRHRSRTQLHAGYLLGYLGEFGSARFSNPLDVSKAVMGLTILVFSQVAVDVLAVRIQLVSCSV